MTAGVVDSATSLPVATVAMGDSDATVTTASAAGVSSGRGSTTRSSTDDDCEREDAGRFNLDISSLSCV